MRACGPPVVLAVCLASGAAAADVSKGVLSQRYSYNNDRIVTSSYSHSVILCFADECSVEGSVIIPDVPSTATERAILVSGFAYEGAHAPTQQLSMKTEIIDYDSMTGEFRWSAVFYAGLPLGSQYEVAYEFTVVFGLPQYFSVVEIDGGCEFDPGMGQCYDSRVVPDVVPAGMKFLGFALHGFSMSANSMINLGRVAIDVSQVATVFYPPGARRNTMTCEMLGLNASGQIEDFSCSAQIVGIAFGDDWLDDTDTEKTKLLAGTGPEYLAESWPTNGVGLFSGLKAFALQSQSGTFQRITDISVGCEQAHLDPQASEGVVVWGADFGGLTPDTWQAEQKCMIGGLVIGQ